MQDLSDAVEKVAALKSQMGGPLPAKDPPPPEARPSYAELSALKEQLQRSELENKSLEAQLVSAKIQAQIQLIVQTVPIPIRTEE